MPKYFKAFLLALAVFLSLDLFMVSPAIAILGFAYAVLGHCNWLVPVFGILGLVVGLAGLASTVDMCYKLKK